MRQFPIYFCSLLMGVLTFYSCSENSDTSTEVPEEEALVSTETDSTSVDAEDKTDKGIWSVYAGQLGLYEQQVVMELRLQGEEVSGSYFYARHQKSLELNGSYNMQTQKMKLTESYKGKVTGYMEFSVQKGDLVGHWMKKEGSADKEAFTASLLPIDKEEFKIRHERYEDLHEITVYNGEDDDYQKVKDECIVSHIGKGLFTFRYSVIGINGHQGSIEGLGRTEKGIAYYEGMDDCRLEFIFKADELTIKEPGDCQYYRGARAYFGGTLKKVR